MHQIAGRAGRFGMHDEGFRRRADEAEPKRARETARADGARAEAPPQFKGAGGAELLARRHHRQPAGRRSLREVLRVFVDQLRLDDAHFEVAELEQMLLLAEQLDACAAALPLQQRVSPMRRRRWTRAPTRSCRPPRMGRLHARQRPGQPGLVPDEVDAHSRLDRMEMALRACTLWLWLGLRFEGVYGHVAEVLAARRALTTASSASSAAAPLEQQLRRGMRRGADQASTKASRPERALGDRGRDDLREAQQRRQPGPRCARRAAASA